MRKLRASIAVVSLLGLAAASLVSSRAGAATAPTYVKTVIGTDFHALDGRLSTMFVPNTGGGVYLHYNGSASIDGPHYLEDNVDLPVGANVMRITIFYRDCTDTDISEATWYFGAYNPNGQFEYLAPSKSQRACAFSSIALVPGGGVRVLPALRYTIGLETPLLTSGAPEDNPDVMVRGARVAYTCPTKCLP